MQYTIEEKINYNFWIKHNHKKNNQKKRKPNMIVYVEIIYMCMWYMNISGAPLIIIMIIEKERIETKKNRWNENDHSG